MRIAIIGAGASGLSAYLFLAKHLPQPPKPLPPHEYVVYESYTLQRRKKGEGSPEIPLVGAGIGIAPNGMKVLFELDQGIHDEIQARGFPVQRMTFKNSRGWDLGSSSMFHEYGHGPEATVMISRQDVLECLLDRVPENLIVHKTVEKLENASGNGSTVVQFTDGTSDSFDLVIGADGVRSKVREAVLPPEYSAYYTGLYGVGGFVPTSAINPVQPRMTFGGNGFFGYSPCTNGSTSLKSSHINGSEPTEPGPQSVWWSSFERDDPNTRLIDMDEMRAQLQERHKEWQDMSIKNITNSEGSKMIAVATWIMPKAPTWVTGRVALIGDAAHALPSTSGQGISQALLDSQALSLLIAHQLKQIYDKSASTEEADAISLALKQFVDVRKSMVEKILDEANRMASHKKEQSFFQEMLMYLILKIIFTFFGNSLQRPVIDYDLEKEIERTLSKE